MGKWSMFLVRFVTQEQIEEDRADGMPEETIQSEYYGSADAPMPGSYYGTIIDKLEKDGRITNVPHDPKLVVHTAWDIGLNDSTSIIFFQAIQQEIRIIDFYENSGEGFPFYARILKDKATTLAYDFDIHYGPHDLSQREMAYRKE